MPIAQLKSFFMVARIGSVTQAAKRLGLSLPTITAQIRALEEACGVERFHRGGRRLAPSGADSRAGRLPAADARGGHSRTRCIRHCPPRGVEPSTAENAGF
ncbi:Transcriptional regulator, LysR family [Cupriavidus basilensis]|uniref:Transcriptional regulator, LysR family n=1 Tax=Cupriavidus basilensis TaxID=68895 RepID=A0A0C4YGP8_9BURK|nr:Transcriptional regulator, LysR family [Cupriavidus basilensis]